LIFEFIKSLLKVEKEKGSANETIFFKLLDAFVVSPTLGSPGLLLTSPQVTTVPSDFSAKNDLLTP